MTPHDASTPDDRFDLLLAAYHDALSSGPAPGSDAVATDLPRELSDRLRKAEAVIHLLEQDRRRWADPVTGPTLSPSAPVAPAPQTGGQFGRFRILRELGRGGHGVVFLAWDPRLRREVALKVPTLGALLAPELRGRFLREAQAAAGLDHPAVVPVLEVGEVGPVWYIASRYCPGGTLADRLRQRSGPLPARAAAALVATLADAVHHTHSRGVLHRDLKPGNVLLDGPGDGAADGDEDGWPRAWGRPLVGDFGLARSVEGADGQTRTGALVGTPDYMAPEQAAGRGRDVSVATDVWALGVILYECLTGRRPFHGGSEHETLQRVLGEPPQAPRSLCAGLPRDLETVCLRCLEKDAARRYASAQALADDLRRFLAGEPVKARPVGGWERAARWARRRPAHAALLGVSVAAALALLVGSAVYSARLRRVNADLEAALEGEQRQAEEARRQQGLAEGREREVRRQAYVSNLWLAGKLWAEGQTGLLAERLNLLRPRPGEEDLRGFDWHYLWRQSRGLRHLRGHHDNVTAVAYSPDGRLFASGSTDGAILLWDPATGEPRGALRGHALAVRSLAFSPDGRQLASGSSLHLKRGELKLWDVAARRHLADLGGARYSVVHVRFTPDGRSLLAWGSADGGEAKDEDSEVRLWDVATGRELPPPVRRSGADRVVTAGAMSADGRLIAVAYHNSNSAGPDFVDFRVWQRDSGREVAYPPLHGKVITCLAFSPDGRLLAAGSHDQTVSLWDVAAGRRQAHLSGPNGSILSLCFSPDSRSLAIGESRGPMERGGGRVVLHDMAGLNRGLTVRLDYDINALAFAPDGRTLAVGSDDRLVRLWDPAGAERCATIAGHAPKEAWAVAFTPDGRLASGGDDHLVRLWNLRAAPPQATELSGHTALVSCVAASPDGRLLASGDYDKAVRLWDAATGQPRGALSGHPKPLRALAFSPDGKLLASGCKGGVVNVWDAQAGKALRSWVAVGDDAVRCLAFSLDGRLLAVGGQDSRVRLYETSTWREVALLDTPSPVFSLAFLGSGRLLTGHKDGVVRSWDVATGQPRLTLLGHTAEVRGVAVSPDGWTIASGGADRSVRLWHADTGLELLSLGTQEHEVNGLAFSADGRRLAAALHDGKVKVWAASDPAPGGGR